MMSDEATGAVIDVLEAAGVPYMLVGSLATNFYSISRSTKDADFVIDLGQTSVRDLVDRLLFRAVKYQPARQTCRRPDFRGFRGEVAHGSAGAGHRRFQRH
jgi:hypothetical protein